VAFGASPNSRDATSAKSVGSISGPNGAVSTTRRQKRSDGRSRRTPGNRASTVPFRADQSLSKPTEA
jgi:hypothetical protein